MRNKAPSEIGVPVASVAQMAARCFPFIVPVLFVFAVQAQAPRLELSRAPEDRTIQLRLSGETNRAYLVEVSTNLTSWRILAQLQTTNGAAILNYDTSQAHHSFLRARSEQTAISLTPQVAPAFGVSAFFSADGGELGLVTPDLRSITLSIPPGCLVKPTEIQLSLVTNLVGLPFAQGTIGTVQIEPEGLVLMGLASLSIEYPPGLDRRRVISFSANNDGTGFNLALDHIYTNRVVIPVSDFAMYGSAIATLDEIQRLRPNAGALAALDIPLSGCFAPPTSMDLETCRFNQRDIFTSGDLSQFPASTHECFGDLVQRALDVQQQLRAYLHCKVYPCLATVIGVARQRQLIGTGSDEELEAETRELASGAARLVCPVYQQMIEPLWPEAQENCALSIVLMQTMLSFERQIQLFALTNVPTCNYTLRGNLDKVCKAAEECINEVKACCSRGRKGQERYLEIQNILRQLEAIGDTNCFPLGMEDPRVQEALDVCLTNAWYGSFNVRHFGQFARTTTQGDTETFESEEVQLKFDGSVFSSDEPPALPGIGKTIGLKILGAGTANIVQTLTSITRTRCRDGSTVESRSWDREMTTGSFSGTNGVNVIWGEYPLGIRIHNDNKNYTITGGGPLLVVKTRSQSFRSRVTCDGGGGSDPPQEPFESETQSLFPMLMPEIKPMGTGAETNYIRGTHRVIDNSGGYPMTTDFTWNFWRAQQR